VSHADRIAFASVSAASSIGNPNRSHHRRRRPRHRSLRDEHRAQLLGLAIAVTLTRGLGQSALSVVSLAMVGQWFTRGIDTAMAIYSILMSVGFMTAFGLIAVMVRRRSNAMVGIAAALMLCYTAGYSFAYEARGYSVMTGCFAVALYTWSEYAAGRSGRPALAGLSLALAAGLWTHYYFVLAFLPIVCGEVARQWHRRRIDLAMWAAIALGALAAAPLWLLMRTAMAQTGTFWARLPHPSVWAVYSALLDILLGSPFPAVAAVIIMLIIAGRVRRSTRSNGRTLPVHEVVAGLACLAIPACAVLVARTIGHDVLVPRYVTFATAGFALVLPLLVWRVAPATGVVDAVVFTVLVLLFTRTLWRTFEPRRLVYVDRMAQYPLLTKQIDTAELTVVTGGTEFVELWPIRHPTAELTSFILRIRNTAVADAHRLGRPGLPRARTVV
jgi:hypothetical protein